MWIKNWVIISNKNAPYIKIITSGYNLPKITPKTGLLSLISESKAYVVLPRDKLIRLYLNP